MGARREDEERADVLVVTAVQEEWAAVLAVETGAKPGSVWQRGTGTTEPQVYYRDFTTETGELRIAVVQAFGMGREHATIAAAPLLVQHPEIRCLASGTARPSEHGSLFVPGAGATPALG